MWTISAVVIIKLYRGNLDECNQHYTQNTCGMTRQETDDACNAMHASVHWWLHVYMLHFWNLSVLMQTTEPDKEIVIRSTCSVREVVICHAFTETRRTMARRDNAVSQHVMYEVVIVSRRTTSYECKRVPTIITQDFTECILLTYLVWLFGVNRFDKINIRCMLWCECRPVWLLRHYSPYTVYLVAATVVNS